MLTIHGTRGSFAFCAAVLLSLTVSPVFAKGGGHGGGGRPSFGGGSGSPAAKSGAAAGSNFSTVNGPGPTMATGVKNRGRGGIGGGFGRGRGGGYSGGYPNSGVTSSGAFWGAGPQWGTGGTGSPSYGSGSVAGGTGANMQVQTYNSLVQGAHRNGLISAVSPSFSAPSNQTASAQPAFKGSPIDDLLKATSK